MSVFATVPRKVRQDLHSVAETISRGWTLDLSMLGGVIDPRIVATRASNGNAFDVAGAMQTYGSNVLRLDHVPSVGTPVGALIEDPRQNILLNSAALATQSVTVTAQAYTLSFYGTGTVVLSGVASGTLIGAGAYPTRSSPLVFTPSAGTLTLTVTGSVIDAQLEAGAWASAYIPTTGVAVTRAIDNVSMPLGAWFNPAAGTLQAEWSWVGVKPAGFPRVVILDDGTLNTAMTILQAVSAGQVYTAGSAASVSQWNFGPSGVYTPNSIYKAAFSYAPASIGYALNGSVSARQLSGSVPSGLTTLRLGADSAGNVQQSVLIRRVRYKPAPSSDAELRMMTL